MNLAARQALCRVIQQGKYHLPPLFRPACVAGDRLGHKQAMSESHGDGSTVIVYLQYRKAARCAAISAIFRVPLPHSSMIPRR